VESAIDWVKSLRLPWCALPPVRYSHWRPGVRPIELPYRHASRYRRHAAAATSGAKGRQVCSGLNRGAQRPHL